LLDSLIANGRLGRSKRDFWQNCSFWSMNNSKMTWLKFIYRNLWCKGYFFKWPLHSLGKRQLLQEQGQVRTRIECHTGGQGRKCPMSTSYSIKYEYTPWIRP
jgi:hypothetical protein